MDLFSGQRAAHAAGAAPLAVRMRPQSLDEFVGQEHFLGPGRLLRRLIEADRLTSAIFYGPPGTGKTTLARVIANATRANFESLHAAEATVKDVRAVLERAQQRLGATGKRTVLFLDEIHRFNRAQQDVLLKDVEDGVLVLIGATTENPFFSVNSPLISRSSVFQFESLTDEQVKGLLWRALVDRERGLGRHEAVVDEDALDFLARRAAGDARRALNALEVAVLSQLKPGGGSPHVTLSAAEESLQRKAIPSDADGDVHYDLASAFIKSMRGSDPDATIYWLSRMLEGGEDPRFIARRICICASEDVGTADSNAILVAAAAAQITEFVGLPECEYPLAHAAIYVACAPKSNAVTRALAAARADVREQPTLPVPNHLRDKSYPGASKLGRGKGYVYPHDDPSGYVPQEYMPSDKVYYDPTPPHGAEVRIAERLAQWRKIREAARAGAAQADRRGGATP
jgi:putative ATPase